MRPCDLTKQEVEHFLKECNFTKDEEDVFLLASKAYTQEEIAEKMNISVSTVKRIYHRIKSKMARI